MATHSSILAWRIPWTEKPGGPQSMGLQRMGHNERLTHNHLDYFTSSPLLLCFTKEIGTQTQGRQFFAAPVHHLLHLVAFQTKSLSLVPTRCLSGGFPVGRRAVWAWAWWVGIRNLRMTGSYIRWPKVLCCFITAVTHTHCVLPVAPPTACPRAIGVQENQTLVHGPEHCGVRKGWLAKPATNQKEFQVKLRCGQREFRPPFFQTWNRKDMG